MAVDPAGEAYITSNTTNGFVVEKLAADGKTVLYQTAVGQNLAVAGIAVDNSGRFYITVRRPRGLSRPRRAPSSRPPQRSIITSMHL